MNTKEKLASTDTTEVQFIETLYRGASYETITSIARKLRTSKASISYHTKHKNESLQQAVDSILLKKINNHNAMTFETIDQVIEFYNIPDEPDKLLDNLMELVINADKYNQQLVTTDSVAIPVVEQKEMKSFMYMNTAYKSISSAIKKLKLSRSVFNHAFYDKKKTIKDSLDTAVLYKVNKFPMYPYKTIQQFVEQLQIDDQSFVNVVADWNNLESSSSCNTNRNSDKTLTTHLVLRPSVIQSIKYKDTIYSSFNDLCNALGIKWFSLGRRLKKGFPLEYAVNETIEASKYYHQRLGKRVIIDNDYYNLGTDLPKLGVDSATFETLATNLSKSTALREAVKNVECVSSTCNNTDVTDVTMKANIGTTLSTVKKCKKYKDRLVTYKGVSYKSLRSLCIELDISLPTLRVFLYKQKLPFEESVTKALESRRIINYRGVRYANKLMVCKTFGLLRSSLTNLTSIDKVNIIDAIDFAITDKINKVLNKSFLNLDEAMKAYQLTDESLVSFVQNLNMLDDSEKTLNSSFMYKGRRYSSFTKLCDYVGVNYVLAREQLRLGKTCEEAIDSVLADNPITSKRFVYNNVEYVNYTDLCRCLKISVDVFSANIKSGMSVEEAVQRGLALKNSQSKSCSYNGITACSKFELLEKLQVSYESVKYYETKGLSFEKAIEVVIANNDIHSKRHKGPIKFRNIEYKSCEKLYAAYYIDRNEVHRFRTTQNLSFEEAIYKAIKNKIRYFLQHNTLSQEEIFNAYKITDESVRQTILCSDDFAETLVEVLKHSVVAD